MAPPEVPLPVVPGDGEVGELEESPSAPESKLSELALLPWPLDPLEPPDDPEPPPPAARAAAARDDRRLHPGVDRAEVGDRAGLVDRGRSRLALLDRRRPERIVAGDRVVGLGVLVHPRDRVADRDVDRLRVEGDVPHRHLVGGLLAAATPSRFAARLRGSDHRARRGRGAERHPAAADSAGAASAHEASQPTIRTILAFTRRIVATRGRRSAGARGRQLAFADSMRRRWVRISLMIRSSRGSLECRRGLIAAATPGCTAAICSCIACATAR